VTLFLAELQVDSSREVKTFTGIIFHFGADIVVVLLLRIYLVSIIAETERKYEVRDALN
jgi:hypothetical protein